MIHKQEITIQQMNRFLKPQDLQEMISRVVMWCKDIGFMKEICYNWHYTLFVFHFLVSIHQSYLLHHFLYERAGFLILWITITIALSGPMPANFLA